MASMLSLALGGVRSGKSEFAEGLAGDNGGPVLYVATGVATDPEMEERIRRHREARPEHWTTLEEPVRLAERLREALSAPDAPSVVLLDSLDVWMANVMEEQREASKAEVETYALGRLSDTLEVMRESGVDAILVSSEVGLSLVPPNPLGRRFQDLLGLVNQKAAAAADRVYLVVAGIPLEVKPKFTRGGGLCEGHDAAIAVSASSLGPLAGMVSLGGDAVEDAAKYDQ